MQLNTYSYKKKFKWKWICEWHNAYVVQMLAMMYQRLVTFPWDLNTLTVFTKGNIYMLLNLNEHIFHDCVHTLTYQIYNFSKFQVKL